MAQICGYNPDGTPYYCPDALGIEIGKEFASSLFNGPGPTTTNLNAAGIASTGSGSSSPLTDAFNFGSGLLQDFGTQVIPNIPGLSLPADIGSALTGGDGGIAGAINRVASTINEATKSVGSAAAFVTDGPRLLTIIIGVMVIALALFALGVHEIFLSTNSNERSVALAAAA